MRHICFTVINDLSYDQRMIHICTSLANAGYEVTLIGAKWTNSIPLKDQPFEQKRLPVWFFGWGKLFYLEYNVRLFFYLLFKKCDIICGIDLDTLVPTFLAAKIRGRKFVFDAHEHFTELEEVVNRPFTKKIWQWVENIFVPKIKYAYTINQSYAEIFEKKSGVKFEIIRNAPLLNEIKILPKKEKFILYQGWVNYGRGLVPLVEAMKEVNARLFICGKGDIYDILMKQVKDARLQEKVIFKGFVVPDELKEITWKACIGVTLFANNGLSNYYSLANRFFDYLHAGIPQITVNYPEYKKINSEYEVALLIDDLSPKTIATALNRLLNDEALYNRLQQNCLKAREVFNWQNEEKKLLEFYRKIQC